MKRWLLAALTTLFSLAAQAQYVTLQGTIQGSNGATAQNYTIAFTPSQWFYVPGTAVVVSTTTNCATSIDGSVVGLPNPLQSVVVSPAFTGTLPAGNYYVEYTFYTASTETLPSPEIIVALSSTGQITVASPAGGVPSGTLGMRVYISATSGTETLQGQTTGNASFVQSIPLVTGVVVPTINNTVCTQIANDAGWPTGTGYKVALADSSGNTVPGYPMLWQLLGPNTTINLSNGLPYYHGVVTFPSPLLASPYNHNTQSISSNLAWGGYNLLGVGKIGVGTSLPAWSIDVATGYINSFNGYLYQGGAGSVGNCLVGYSIGGGLVAYAPGSCGTLPTLFYQTMAANGTLRPQEPFLNFTPRLTAVDNPGSTRTDVDLATTAVTPGSYTSSNITVDAYGRVTAATNGTAIPVIQSLIINSGICTTAAAAYATCSVTGTWGAAFANTAYAMTCTAFDAQGTNAVLASMTIHSKSTTGFVLTLQNDDASGAGATTVNEIDCIGMHP